MRLILIGQLHKIHVFGNFYNVLHSDDIEIGGFDTKLFSECGPWGVVFLNKWECTMSYLKEGKLLFFNLSCWTLLEKIMSSVGTFLAVGSLYI